MPSVQGSGLTSIKCEDNCLVNLDLGRLRDVVLIQNKGSAFPRSCLVDPGDDLFDEKGFVENDTSEVFEIIHSLHSVPSMEKSDNNGFVLFTVYQPFANYLKK